MPGYSVALVIGQLEGGGAEKHCWWLARTLRRYGIPVEVIAIEALPATRDRYAELDIPLTLVDGERRARRPPAWHPGRLLRFARRCTRLRAALARRRPYLVHSFLPYANIVVAAVRRGTGVSVHVAGHRYAGRAGRLYNASQAAQTLLGSACELHLANSAEVGRFLVEELAIPAGRVAVAVNGIAAEETLACADARGAVRCELGLGEDEIAFGMVCNLWPYKGIDTFQEALAIAHREHPRLRGFVAGRDVGTLGRLEERSRLLGIASNFTFLGERSDVCRLLRGFDVLVSASRGEGMSNSILEAMAHALPVVGSRAAGTADLLDEGRAGLLFDAGNAAALARHLVLLAKSPSERARLGAAAADRAARHFPLERTVEETLRAYATASRAEPAAAEYFARAAEAVSVRSEMAADRGRSGTGSPPA